MGRRVRIVDERAGAEFSGTERFEIVRKLGQGGMGAVFEAFDRERGVVVAVKTLPLVTAASLYRFKREFRALADITHPNLISLGELIEHEGQWFFTMDYVDGVDFLCYARVASGAEGALSLSTGTADALADTASLGEESRATSSDGWDRQRTAPGASPDETVRQNCDEARLRHASKQLAVAIAALHRAGKVHRDIKPSNILVDSLGKLTLLDFGLAIGATDDAYASTQAHAVGTAAYMSPEQAISGTVEAAADWYSFGVVLYEALTGMLPFTGRTSVELLLKKQQYEPAPPRARIADTPKDLDALCVDLLARNPEDRPGATEVLERLGIETTSAHEIPTAQTLSHHSEAPVFVGRDAELGMLRAAWVRTERGSAEVMLVEGESGLGKSTLVSRFIDEIRKRMPDAVVLTGRCHERETVPYKALDGVIDGLSRCLRKLPATETAALIPRNAALLPRVFPVLGRVEEISLAPRSRVDIADGHVLRTQSFAALRELLYRCAERRPLVIWIDDFQWTDGDSLIALRTLVRSDEAPRALFILSSRHISSAGAEGAALAEFIDAVMAERARLGPLSSASATELAKALLENAGRSGEGLAEHIAEEAEGHPLYIAELARHAAQEGRGTGEQLRLSDVITSRVAQLPTTTRWILDLVAVAGAPLSRAILQAASRVDTETFGKQAAMLRVAQLVRTHGHRNHDPIEPYHDYVRQAVLAAQEPSRRRECHGRLAAALQTEARSGVPPEIVLVHLEGAGQLEDAARFAEAAAKRADGALSFDLAARLYATAIRLGDPAPVRRRALIVNLGDATANAGRRAEAAQLFLQAVEGASAADALELQRQAAEWFLVSGHLDEGIDVLRRVLAEVGIPGPRSPSSALRSVIFQRAWLRIRGLRFREREESEVAPLEIRRLDACLSAAIGLGMTSNLHGTAFQTRHLRLALKEGEPTRAAMALAIEGLYTSLRGRAGAGRALAVAARALDLAERHESNLARAWVKTGTGMSHYQVGAFARALSDWEQALALFSLLPGFHFERSTLQLYHAWAYFYLGRWRKLYRDVRVQLQLARDRGDLYGATNFTSGLPSVASLIRDQPHRARRLAREHADKWSHRGFHLQHFWEMYALAQASLYERDAKAAWAHIDGRWAALRRSFLLRIAIVDIEAHDTRARCALALAARLPADDPERRALIREAKRCTRRVRRAGNDCATALDLVVRAGLARLSGSDEESICLLRESVLTFEGAGMDAHAEIARFRLGVMVGGREGSSLVRRADEWLKSQEVVNPRRMVGVFAPGLGRQG